MHQYRPPEAARAGQPMYCPARDILYLMPHVLAKVPQQVLENHCATMSRLCRDNNVTHTELQHAFECYADFVAKSHEPEFGPKVYNALDASGWAACHPVARIAVLYYTGQTMTYTLWKAIREATHAGQESAAPLQDLMAWTEEAVRYAKMTWWQKFVYRFWRFFDSPMRQLERQW